MAKKRGRINLNILLSQTNQPKLYAKALAWLLSTGKYFVVVVELIVIGGFVYRFALDAQLEDLQDQINQQVPYIKSLQEDEVKARQTHLQLTTIRETRHNDTDMAEVMRKVASLTPKNVSLVNITVDKTQIAGKTVIRIIGTAANNYEVSYLLKAMQKDPMFAEVTLGNVSLEKALVNFTISGSVIKNQSRRVS